MCSSLNFLPFYIHMCSPGSEKFANRDLKVRSSRKKRVKKAQKTNDMLESLCKIGYSKIKEDFRRNLCEHFTKIFNYTNNKSSFIIIIISSTTADFFNSITANTKAGAAPSRTALEHKQPQSEYKPERCM